MSERNDFEILTTSRLWVATPSDYSSSRWLRLKSDEISDCCYGYGQTIYAVVRFQFEITTQNTLKLTYLESPPLSETSHFRGYIPTTSNSTKEFNYQLVEKVTDGSHAITGKKFKHHWILTLDKSPFPEEIQFPYEVPLEYYGHRED